MIYLGVDLGDRRIGFAVADTQCLVATMLPAARIKNPSDAPAEIVKIYRENQVDLAIVGLPLSMNGKRGDKAKAAEKIAAHLREQGLNIELWDERLTTEEARRTLADNGITRKKRQEKLDSMAAQRILSSFLTARCQPVQP